VYKREGNGLNLGDGAGKELRRGTRGDQRWRTKKNSDRCRVMAAVLLTAGKGDDCPNPKVENSVTMSKLPGVMEAKVTGTEVRQPVLM